MKWIEFVKAYAKKNNIKYGEALKKAKGDWAKHKASSPEHQSKPKKTTKANKHSSSTKSSKKSTKPNIKMSISDKKELQKIKNLAFALEKDAKTQTSLAIRKQKEELASLVSSAKSVEDIKDELLVKGVPQSEALSEAKKLSALQKIKIKGKEQSLGTPIGGAFDPNVLKGVRKTKLTRYKKLKAKVQKDLKDGKVINREFNSLINLAKHLAGKSTSNQYAKLVKKLEKEIKSKAYGKVSRIQLRQAQKKGILEEKLEKDMKGEKARNQKKALNRVYENRIKQLKRLGATDEEAEKIAKEETRNIKEQQDLQRELQLEKFRKGGLRTQTGGLSYQQFVEKTAKDKGVSYNSAVSLVKNQNLFQKYQVSAVRNSSFTPSIGISTSTIVPTLSTPPSLVARGQYITKDGRVKKTTQKAIDKLLSKYGNATTNKEIYQISPSENVAKKDQELFNKYKNIGILSQTELDKLNGLSNTLDSYVGGGRSDYLKSKKKKVIIKRPPPIAPKPTGSPQTTPPPSPSAAGPSSPTGSIQSLSPSPSPPSSPVPAPVGQALSSPFRKFLADANVGNTSQYENYLLLFSEGKIKEAVESIPVQPFPLTKIQGKSFETTLDANKVVSGNLSVYNDAKNEKFKKIVQKANSLLGDLSSAVKGMESKKQVINSVNADGSINIVQKDKAKVGIKSASKLIKELKKSGKSNKEQYDELQSVKLNFSNQKDQELIEARLKDLDEDIGGTGGSFSILNKEDLEHDGDEEIGGALNVREMGKKFTSSLTRKLNQFKEPVNLIISGVGAIKGRKVKKQNAIDKEDKHLLNMTIGSYKKASERRDVDGFKYNSAASNEEHAVWVNEAIKKVVIAYRGSRTQEDWLVSDKHIAKGTLEQSDRYKRELKFTNDIVSKIPSDYEIEFTGSSLGGTLAYTLGHATKQRAVVFNPGVGIDGAKKHGDDNTKMYHAQGDPISIMGLGKFKDSRMVSNTAGNFARAHSTSVFQTPSEGGFSKGEMADDHTQTIAENNEEEKKIAAIESSSKVKEQINADQNQPAVNPNTNSAPINNSHYGDLGDFVAGGQDAVENMTQRDIDTYTDSWGGGLPIGSSKKAFEGIAKNKIADIKNNIKSYEKKYNPNSVRNSLSGGAFDLDNYLKFKDEHDLRHAELHSKVKNLHNFKKRTSGNMRQVVDAHLKHFHLKLNHLDKNVAQHIPLHLDNHICNSLNHDRRKLTDIHIHGTARPMGGSFVGGSVKKYVKYDKHHDQFLKQNTDGDIDVRGHNRMGEIFNKLGDKIVSKLKGGNLTNREHRKIFEVSGKHLNKLKLDPHFQHYL